MEALVFGGTTEGRQLVQWLSARGNCDIVYCAATEYGASMVDGCKNVTALVGPISDEEKARLVAERDVACIVDATHPYANHISASIDRLGKECKKNVIRIVRDEPSDGASDWTSVNDVDEAVAHVAHTHGNVLLTTGTKDLACFVGGIPCYQERLYVRILPVAASLAKAESLHIPTSHIVAMQGPFSVRLNSALIRELDISVMVTKQSGDAGGFTQKVEAARECGVELVVIGRPPNVGGMSMEEAQRLLEDYYGW